MVLVYLAKKSQDFLGLKPKNIPRFVTCIGLLSFKLLPAVEEAKIGILKRFPMHKGQVNYKTTIAGIIIILILNTGTVFKSFSRPTDFLDYPGNYFHGSCK